MCEKENNVYHLCCAIVIVVAILMFVFFFSSTSFTVQIICQCRCICKIEFIVAVVTIFNFLCLFALNLYLNFDIVFALNFFSILFFVRRRFSCLRFLVKYIRNFVCAVVLI